MKRISLSEITEYKDCRRKWFIHHRLNLSKKDKSGALALGTNVHDALQVFYTPGGTKEAAMAKFDSIYWSLKTDANEYEIEDVCKDEELGRIMLEGYWAWVEETGVDAHLEIIEAEADIEYQIDVAGVPVTLMGKRDLIGRNALTGTAQLLDHKGQPYHSEILTPNGWVKMGDLEIGSIIMNHRHQPTKVVGVFELGEQEIFEVLVSDNTTVECTSDHLWEMMDGNIVELSKWIKNPPNMPIVGSDPDYEESPIKLPMDPYSLGCFLGDGSFRRTTPTFFNENIEIFDRLGLDIIIPKDESRCLYANAYSWTEPLKSLGLFWHRSEEKFIPELYLYSSAVQRLALLRGLMDTDGYVHISKGNCHFDTSSEMLKDGIEFLVKSLGGWATSHKHNTYYTKNGERHPCLPSWRVAVRMPVTPFLLKSKVRIFETLKGERTRQRRPNKRVKSITSVGFSQARCIKVEDERQLYVTDGYTITHNTCQSFTDNMLDINEQARMYLLLQMLVGSTEVQEVLWNKLRKVKRTARAKPPFYQREELYISEEELRRFYIRTLGTIKDILMTEAKLDAGEDHYEVCYPRPSSDCSWKCQYRKVCPLMDSDPEAAKQMLSDMFQVEDPYARYTD